MEKTKLLDTTISENIQNAIALSKSIKNQTSSIRRESWESLNKHKKNVFRLFELGHSMSETVSILSESGIYTDEEMLNDLVGIKMSQKRSNELFIFSLLSAAVSLLLAIVWFGPSPNAKTITPDWFYPFVPFFLLLTAISFAHALS